MASGLQLAAFSLPPLTAAELARHFARAPEPKVAELLDVLVSLGQARQVEGGRYAA